MRGNITRRGKSSWRIKVDVGADSSGKRLMRYLTVRGTKATAEKELTKLLGTIHDGSYVEPVNTTVGEFVRRRIDQWESAGTISARTAARYRQLLEHQIAPHIGQKPLQKLRPLDFEEWHTTLRQSGRVRGQGGLAARTIGHAHRVVSKALADAARNDLIGRNAATLEQPPTVPKQEMIIVRDVAGLVDKLRGSAMGAPALLGLLCGMRLGEVLAVRWNCVDFDRKVIQVREAIEQTKAHGIRFKPPKSAAGRRDISLPDPVVEAMREHRREQLELRLKLGTGKLPDDALLFGDLQGNPRSLNAASAAWRAFAKSVGLPGVTFHALRHSHASQLIDAGVDIVTISRRLGHAKPDITLRIYAHLFRKDDSKAAAAINAVLGEVITMTDPEDPGPFINTARDHLRTAAKLSVTDLDDYAAEASCTSDEAETDIGGEIKKHFLAACAEVLTLMERGQFDEARALQAEISAWVDYHTEEND